MNNKNAEYAEEVSHAFGTFRREIRSAIYPFWPNNPAVGDDEIVEAIKRLVDQWLTFNGQASS